MPYIYIIFELFIKITKYKFTVKAFISHKITRKMLFEPVSDLPNIKDKPGPREDWASVSNFVAWYGFIFECSTFLNGTLFKKWTPKTIMEQSKRLKDLLKQNFYWNRAFFGPIRNEKWHLHKYKLMYYVLWVLKVHNNLHCHDQQKVQD